MVDGKRRAPVNVVVVGTVGATIVWYLAQPLRWVLEALPQWVAVKEAAGLSSLLLDGTVVEDMARADWRYWCALDTVRGILFNPCMLKLYRPRREGWTWWSPSGGWLGLAVSSKFLDRYPP